MSQKQSWKAAVNAPVFAVADVEQSIKCYRDELGFNVEYQWPQDEKPSYAILCLDKSSIHLTQSNRPRPAIAYFFIDGIDACYQTMQNRTGRISSGIQTHPYHMREFEITDADGNKLVFGEHVSRLSTKS